MASTASLTDWMHNHIAQQSAQIFRDLQDCVAHKSVFLEDQDSCLSSAKWVKDAFTAVGIPNIDIREAVDGSYPLFGYVEPAADCPTVLLYCHHDVQPADDQPGWDTNPWVITEKDGRWYGRGTADDKGNLVALLAALRALRDWAPSSEHPDHPFGGVGIRLVVEGSEEAGGEGLDDWLAQHPEWFAADAMLIADTGNVAVGAPTINISLRGVAMVQVKLRTLEAPVHSGQYGGPAPDALLGLISMLASLRDADGGLTIDDLPYDQEWEGVPYAEDAFAHDAGVLPGVDLCTAGTPAEMTWARPALTVTGLDATPINKAINAIPSEAAALLSLRVPPTMDPRDAQQKLIAHLEKRVPWNAQVEFGDGGVGAPYMADISGTAHQGMAEALAAAYGKKPEEVLLSGGGGSIPLCAALKEAHPDAQLVLYGVEEPLCAIHGPNESVDPTEITAIATASALFLATFTG